MRIKSIQLGLIILLLFIITSLIYFNRESRYLYKNISDDQLANQIVNILSINYYVILSANLDDLKSDFYFYYLPITCASWRRIYYEPIVILVSADFSKLNDEGKLVIEYLNDMKVKTVRLKIRKELNLFVSMISRIFVGLLSDDLVNDEDFVITSDADIIPFDKKYYYSFKAESDIVLWNAYCCGSFDFKGKQYTMYPLSHIGMRKKHWRQVMNIQPEDYGKLNKETIMKIMKELHGDSEVYNGQSEIQRGDKFWYMDQVTISVNIVKNGKGLKVDKIAYKGKRQDRAISSLDRWISNLESIKHKLTDFHLFHADVFQKNESINRLLDALFSNDQVKVIDYFKNYTAQFIETRSKLQNLSRIAKS